MPIGYATNSGSFFSVTNFSKFNSFWAILFCWKNVWHFQLSWIVFPHFCNSFGIICDFTNNFTKFMMCMPKSFVVNEK